MISGYRHTGLVVRDLKKSRMFYENVLGFKLWKQAIETGAFIEKVVDISGVILEWVKLIALDGSILELLQYHTSLANEGPIKPQSANKLGSSHIAFTIEDIQRSYKTLCDQGIHCNSEPQLSPDGSVKVLYCHDPDGIIVELVEECTNRNNG